MTSNPQGETASEETDDDPSATSQTDDSRSWTDQLLGLADEMRAVRASLVIIAIAAIVGLLHFAKPILIPIVLAFFLSYVLNPFVNVLMRLRIPATRVNMPRGLASLIVVVCSVSFAGLLGTFIGDQIRRLILDLRHYQDQFVDNINRLRETVSDLQARVEGFLDPFRREGEGIAPTDEAGDPVEGIEMFSDQGGGADFWSTATDFIAGGLTGFLGIVAQALMCIFVLVFILAQGPALHRRIVNAAAGEIEKKRRAAKRVLKNVNDDVQRYLFNRFATNTCVAIIVGLIFYLYGLDFAFLLGIFAGLFNFIPYVGPIVGSVFPATVAYVQFGELQAVLWCVLIYASVTGLEGNLVTPYVIGRHLKLNSLAVLLSAIFWGWMWGAIGLLLAIPIVATMKSVSENVDGLGGLAAFLRG